MYCSDSLRHLMLLLYLTRVFYDLLSISKTEILHGERFLTIRIREVENRKSLCTLVILETFN